MGCGQGEKQVDKAKVVNIKIQREVIDDKMEGKKQTDKKSESPEQQELPIVNVTNLIIITYLTILATKKIDQDHCY